MEIHLLQDNPCSGMAIPNRIPGSELHPHGYHNRDSSHYVPENKDLVECECHGYGSHVEFTCRWANTSSQSCNLVDSNEWKVGGLSCVQ